MATRIEVLQKAAAHLQQYVRSHHDDLKEIFRETSPGAGYGRYSGYDKVRNAGAFIFDYTDENFLNAGVPGTFGSTESFTERLNTYIKNLRHFEAQIQKVIEAKISKDGVPPDNARALLSTMTDYRRVAEETLEILSERDPAPKDDELKVSPPNWANKTSAIVAVILAVAGAIFWSAKLQYQVEYLKDRVSSLETSSSQSSKGAEVGAKSELCSQIFSAYRDARSDIRLADAEAYEKLLAANGCAAAQ